MHFAAPRKVSARSRMVVVVVATPHVARRTSFEPVGVHPSWSIALLDDDAHVGSDIIVGGSVRKRIDRNMSSGGGMRQSARE
jgi:hypothetical protein